MTASERDRRGPARRQRGASLVEYTLLLVLIVVVCLAAVTLLGDKTSTSYSEISSQVADA